MIKPTCCGYIVWVWNGLRALPKEALPNRHRHTNLSGGGTEKPKLQVFSASPSRLGGLSISTAKSALLNNAGSGLGSIQDILLQDFSVTPA